MRISNAGANKEGAWAYYTDGSSIKFIAAINKTIVSDMFGDETILEGRQGI